MEHIGIHKSCWSDTYVSISTGFQGIFSLIFEGHPSNFRINSRAVIKNTLKMARRSIFFTSARFCYVFWTRRLLLRDKCYYPSSSVRKFTFCDSCQVNTPVPQSLRKTLVRTDHHEMLLSVASLLLLLQVLECAGKSI